MFVLVRVSVLLINKQDTQLLQTILNCIKTNVESYKEACSKKFQIRKKNSRLPFLSIHRYEYYEKQNKKKSIRMMMTKHLLPVFLIRTTLHLNA